MRGYLVGQQLTIAGSRPRRNCAVAFPLLDAELHKLSDRYFVGFDIGALANRGEKFNELCFGFLSGTAKCLILDFAFASSGITLSFELETPRFLAALLKVAAHDLSLSSYLAALRKVACLVIGCLSWQTHLFVGLRDDHGVGNRGAYVSYYDKFGGF